jgi:hypothetical protein
VKEFERKNASTTAVNVESIKKKVHHTEATIAKGKKFENKTDAVLTAYSNNTQG